MQGMRGINSSFCLQLDFVKVCWNFSEKCDQVVPGAAARKCCQGHRHWTGTGRGQELLPLQSYTLFAWSSHGQSWSTNKILACIGGIHFCIVYSRTPEQCPCLHVSMSRGWSLVSADVTVQCPGNSSHSLSAKQTWPRELMWGWMSSTKSMEGELQWHCRYASVKLYCLGSRPWSLREVTVTSWWARLSWPLARPVPELRRRLVAWPSLPEAAHPNCSHRRPLPRRMWLQQSLIGEREFYELITILKCTYHHIQAQK